MTGENDYEVHVGLTGLSEAITQLESFESRLREIGGNQRVDASVINQVAEAKAQILGLESQVNAAATRMHEALAGGLSFAGRDNLTSQTTRQVEGVLVQLERLRQSAHTALPAELRSTVAVAIDVDFDNIRKGIVNATLRGVREMQEILQSAGENLGIPERRIRSAVGTEAGLASALGGVEARTIGPSTPTSNPIVVEQQRSAAAEILASERLAQADRDLAQTRERQARAIDLSGLDTPDSRGGGGYRRSDRYMPGRNDGESSGGGGGGTKPPTGGGPSWDEDDGEERDKYGRRRLPTDLPDGLGLSFAEASLRAGGDDGRAYRIGGENGRFAFPHETNPDITGPGQSPFFEIVRGKKDEADSIRRIIDPTRVQQLSDDPTTLADRRKVQAAQDKLIQAQNEETVALLESAGILKKQNAKYSRMDDGTFIRRTGAGALSPVVEGDSTYYQDISEAREAAVRQAGREAALAKRTEKLDQTNTLGGTFLGGFTSKGFENPGQGILPALAGTAGVLARYSLDGAAMAGVAVGLHNILSETESYDTALVELNHAIEAVGAGHISMNRAFEEGAKYGIDEATAIELGTAGIRNYAQEIAAGADATDVFTESIKQAGINAVITGQKVAESQKQLLAITNEFGTGYQGQAGATDAVFNASQRFNASPADIQKALVENGDLAQVAGFDQERLAATTAAVIGQGASPAGLSRLLARGGNQQFQGAIASLGVTNTGNISDELDKASEAYGRLTNAQKAAFAEQSGGARSASILIALLKEQKAINESVTESYTEGGKAAQTALDLQNTAAGQLKQFFTDLKNLGGEIGQSGVADILVLMFEVLKSGVEILDTVTHGVNQFLNTFGPLKDIVITAAELYAVMRAIAGISAEGTIAGGVSALASKIRHKTTHGQDVGESEIPAAADGAASEIAAAGTTVAASLEEAAAAIRGASGVAATEVLGGAALIRDAEVTAAAEVRGAGGLGGFLTTESEIGRLGLGGGLSAGTVGAIVAAVVATGVLTDKAYRNAQEQKRASEAAYGAGSAGTGSGDDLGNDARKASAAAQRARASSSGIIGSLINGASKIEGFGSTGDAAKFAENTAAELAREAERQKKAESHFNDSIGLAGNFNLNAPDFTKGVQDLIGQGQNYTEVGNESLTFLQKYQALQQGSRSYLAPGQGDVLSGKVANTTTSGLREAVQDYSDRNFPIKSINDYTLHSGAKSIDALSKQKQKDVNDALNKSTQEFIESNDLEGEDLAKLPLSVLQRLQAKNAQALRDALKKAGVSGKELDALTGVIADSAALGVSKNAYDINGRSGTPLTQSQVSDVIKNAPAIAKGIGASAGLDNLLGRGLDSDQQSADLKAQETYLQSVRTSLASSNPLADLSVLDDLIKQTKVDLANAAGAQAKAMGKFAADMLSPLDVSGRLEAQLKAVQAAAKTDTGQALRDDIAQGKQLQFQINTRNNVTAPGAAEALGLSTASALSAPKLAVDNAQRDLNDAIAQKADQATIDQKRQAVRQAQQSYTQAQVADANAARDSNVQIGNKVGELQAKYQDLIAQANTQTGGQRADTLHQAQQALVDEQIAQAEIAGKVAAASIDPRDKIGDLRQQLTNLQGQVFAPGDTGGRADNAKQQATLRQQIAQEQAAIAAAAVESRVFTGDSLGEARARLVNAKQALDLTLKGTKEWYTALKQLRDAQYAVSAEVDSARDLLRELGSDRTDPVFNALDALRKAQEKLARDRAAHAPANIVNKDNIDVQAASESAQRAQFDQQMQTMQTAKDLNQISLTSYMSFLQNQDKTLRDQLKGMKKGAEGYQQLVDELNTVDQAIKSTNEQSAGMFNLGDIKVATPYEARRAVATGVGNGGSMQTTNVTTININGSNLDKVDALLRKHLGPDSTTRVTVSPKKGA